MTGLRVKIEKVEDLSLSWWQWARKGSEKGRILRTHKPSPNVMVFDYLGIRVVASLEAEGGEIKYIVTGVAVWA